MLQTKVTEKIKTQFCVPSLPPLPPEIVTFMRQCGKNIVDPDRPQMSTWRRRFACRIPKATSTYSE